MIPRLSAVRDEKSFLEHLEDLRRCLIQAAIWFVVGLGVAIPLAPRIMSLLKMPLRGIVPNPDTFVRVIRVGDGCAVAMQVMFWSGLIIALPGILFAAARFVYPGLTRKERRTVTGSLLMASLLFVCGVVLGYLTTIRFAVSWLLKFNNWIGVGCDFVELSDYCGFVLRLLAGFGLAFELPIVVVALGSVGLISSRAMRTKRRHVIVGLMTLAMILGPPDPGMSMTIISVPLILLYECCIWIVWMKERGRAGQTASTSADSE